MPGPQHPRTGLVGVLRGSFGLLWAGQTPSMLGDGVFLVAFTWQFAVRCSGNPILRPKGTAARAEGDHDVVIELQIIKRDAGGP